VVAVCEVFSTVVSGKADGGYTVLVVLFARCKNTSDGRGLVFFCGVGGIVHGANPCAKEIKRDSDALDQTRVQLLNGSGLFFPCKVSHGPAQQQVQIVA